jgi:hypothetical protein
MRGAVLVIINSRRRHYVRFSNDLMSTPDAARMKQPRYPSHGSRPQQWPLGTSSVEVIESIACARAAKSGAGNTNLIVCVPAVVTGAGDITPTANVRCVVLQVAHTSQIADAHSVGRAAGSGLYRNEMVFCARRFAAPISSPSFRRKRKILVLW